jgi:hypothetical protein
VKLALRRLRSIGADAVKLRVPHSYAFHSRNREGLPSLNDQRVRPGHSCELFIRKGLPRVDRHQVEQAFRNIQRNQGARVELRVGDFVDIRGDVLGINCSRYYPQPKVQGDVFIQSPIVREISASGTSMAFSR